MNETWEPTYEKATPLCIGCPHEAEVEKLRGAVHRFVKYAELYPEDISGPLADNFLPMLKSAAKIADNPSICSAHPERVQGCPQCYPAVDEEALETVEEDREHEILEELLKMLDGAGMDALVRDYRKRLVKLEGETP